MTPAKSDPAPSTVSFPIEKWTPLNFHWEDDEAVVEWCDFKDMAFTDPFFIDTFFRLQDKYIDNHTRKLAMDSLLDNSPSGTIDPSGFIFHISRCGSTLVSRTLGNLDHVLALGEPDPILGFLEHRHKLPPATQKRLFKKLIHFLGNPRRTSERHFVIKFTSFNLFDIDFILSVFPDTPWTFVYRHPAEVISSVLEKPTGFFRMKQEPEVATQFLDVPGETIANMSDQEYLGRFLAKMFDQISSQTLPHRKRALFVNYNRLPVAIGHEIANHFSIPLNHEDNAKIHYFSQHYSKSRGEAVLFSPEREKRELGPLWEQVRPWVETSYRRMQQAEALQAQS